MKSEKKYAPTIEMLKRHKATLQRIIQRDEKTKADIIRIMAELRATAPENA